jgi:hypothetical protein
MPPRTNPQTAAGQALMERTEAVRDRVQEQAKRKDRLIAINGKLTVILKASESQRDNSGQAYMVKRPILLKFDGYTCNQTADGKPLTDPEIQELIEQHPAYVGTPVQPKVMAWAGEPLAPWNRQMPIQTIRGAVGAGPRPVEAPHPEWDTLEPDALRQLVNDGIVNIQRAIHWEADHRRRPAVMVDLAEAMGRGVAGPEVVEPPEVYAVASTPETFGPAEMGG